MELTRRSLIAGTAAAGIAAGMAGSIVPARADEAAQTATAHPWQTKPEPITDIAETLDYDIVIVGAGVAGMSAAEAAARNGAKTVVIERSSQVSWRGMDVGNVGSKVQKDAGVEIDPREAARLLHFASQQTANYSLLYTWASRSGKVFDHIQEITEAHGRHMIQADGSSGTAKFGWDKYDYPWKVLQTAVNFTGDDGAASSENLLYVLETTATELGCEFAFDTRAEQLVGDAASGVTGVIATAEDGSHIQYNASKGVILACGDIGGNPEMLSEFSPIVLRADGDAYTPLGCNTGDGVLMGVWAGAAMSKSQPAPMVHQFAFVNGEWNYNYAVVSFYMSWLNVNRKGQRYGADLPYEPMLTNARMNQPGNVAWSIFDSEWDTYVKKQLPDIYDMVMSWGTIEDFEKSSLCTKADTIEELAEKLGIDPETLAATVERYNSMYDAGLDSDFGVPAELLTRIQTPPFYASPNLCSRLVVPFGLHVNDDSQVCTEADEPIAGLYAIGNMQGDFFAFSYPVHCPGVSHGRCVTFGQLVGEALAQGKTITQTATEEQ